MNDQPAIRTLHANFVEGPPVMLTVSTTTTSIPKSPTLMAQRFRKPLVALSLGIVLPLICLKLDPIVFRGTFTPAILGSYKSFGYGVLSLAMLALAAWLLWQRLPSFFFGCLIAGYAFALILGFLLLPVSFAGLLFLIGFLGFSPFLTASTYWYCAQHAREVAGQRFKPFVALAAFAMMIVVPFSMQKYVSNQVGQSLNILRTGTNESAAQAVAQLKSLSLVFDVDSLAWRYGESDSEMEKERLTNAYRELTGGDIEETLDVVLD